jgi:hypothetical protein
VFCVSSDDDSAASHQHNVLTGSSTLVGYFRSEQIFFRRSLSVDQSNQPSLISERRLMGPFASDRAQSIVEACAAAVKTKLEKKKDGGKEKALIVDIPN